MAFAGSPADAERACLWSRLASRIFVVLGRFACANAEDLYEATHSIAWERILRAGATIAVTARGTNDELRNSHFAALRVKDALCDRMLEVEGRRPNVDTDDPDARISLTLRGNRASIQLDLSGDPLFKRLPREATRTHAAHVLRPDYAALACAQGNWQEICSTALTNTKDAMGDEDTAAPTDGSASADGNVLAGSTVERPHPHAPRPDRRLLHGRRRGARGRLDPGRPRTRPRAPELGLPELV